MPVKLTSSDVEMLPARTTGGLHKIKCEREGRFCRGLSRPVFSGTGEGSFLFFSSGSDFEGAVRFVDWPSLSFSRLASTGFAVGTCSPIVR